MKLVCHFFFFPQRKKLTERETRQAAGNTDSTTILYLGCPSAHSSNPVPIFQLGGNEIICIKTVLHTFSFSDTFSDVFCFQFSFFIQELDVLVFIRTFCTVL